MQGLGTYVYLDRDVEVRIFVRDPFGPATNRDPLREYMIREGATMHCGKDVDTGYVEGTDVWDGRNNCLSIRTPGLRGGVHCFVVFGFETWSGDPRDPRHVCNIHLICALKGYGYGSMALHALEEFCRGADVVDFRMDAIPKAVSFYLSKHEYAFAGKDQLPQELERKVSFVEGGIARTMKTRASGGLEAMAHALSYIASLGYSSNADHAELLRNSSVEEIFPVMRQLVDTSVDVVKVRNKRGKLIQNALSAGIPLEKSIRYRSAYVPRPYAFEPGMAIPHLDSRATFPRKRRTPLTALANGVENHGRFDDPPGAWYRTRTGSAALLSGQASRI